MKTSEEICSWIRKKYEGCDVETINQALSKSIDQVQLFRYIENNSPAMKEAYQQAMLTALIECNELNNLLEEKKSSIDSALKNEVIWIEIYR